jgi:cell division protein FtsL
MQQINLYNAAFEKNRELLSLPGVAMIWAIALAVTAAAAVFSELRADAAARQAEQESRARAAIQADMSRLAAQAAARSEDPALAGELKRLQVQLDSRHLVIETLSRGVIGNTEGFSEYLRAFARQSFEGLWLTGLSVSGAGQEVVLQGRALQPELVPGYVQRLNRERIMKGHAFEDLRMNRPESESAASSVPFVEFRLATFAATERAR